MDLLFRMTFILQLLIICHGSTEKRLIVEESVETLAAKLNAMEKEITVLKAQQAKQANTVAFMADLTTHEHGTNHHIYFDNVKTNIGNAYNPIHGTFVAPVYGLYQFSITACSESAHFIVLELTLNATNIGKLIAGDDSYGDCNSKSFVVKLSAGDNVFVQHKTVGEWLFANPAYGLPSFTGFLIKAL